jgi:hypothetical protein
MDARFLRPPWIAAELCAISPSLTTAICLKLPTRHSWKTLKQKKRSDPGGTTSPCHRLAQRGLEVRIKTDSDRMVCGYLSCEQGKSRPFAFEVAQIKTAQCECATTPPRLPPRRGVLRCVPFCRYLNTGSAQGRRLAGRAQVGWLSLPDDQTWQ